MSDADELTKVLLGIRVKHGLIEVTITGGTADWIAADILASPWGQRVQALEAELAATNTGWHEALITHDELFDEAEQIRIDRDRLREALEELIAAVEQQYEDGTILPTLVRANQKARAALGGKEVAP